MSTINVPVSFLVNLAPESLAEIVLARLDSMSSAEVGNWARLLPSSALACLFGGAHDTEKPVRADKMVEQFGAAAPAAAKRSLAYTDEELAELLGFVRRNPGNTSERISKQFTFDTKIALVRLLKSGELRTEGKARGTKYFPTATSEP